MDYAMHVVVMAALAVILSTSLNLLIGVAGLFALSQAAFYACGAYVTGILATWYGVPFPLTTAASALLVTGFGVVAALPALRVGGHYLVVVTLALAIIVVDILANGGALTGGTEGITGVPKASLFGWALDTPARFTCLAVPAAAVCVWLVRQVSRAPLGRALRAMRDDELAAQSVGKDIVALKLKVFGLSAGLAAVAGSLLAHYISYIGPNAFGVDLTITIMAMVIVGGTGNEWGAVAGALLLVLLPELLKFLPLPVTTADLIRNVLYGLVLIAVLRFRPGGLLAERARLPKIDGTAPTSCGPVTAPISGRTAAALVATGLAKSFGGIRAVVGVDLNIPPGTVTGLIGPNGAGKTTAFNLLTGFVPPTEGEIRYRERLLTGVRPHAIVRAGIARSFQNLRLFGNMTVVENVLVAFPDQLGDRLLPVLFRPGAVGAEQRANATRARALLRFIGLAVAEETGVADLAYADQKLLVIARLLATGAEVLLLDEPLSGLDAPAIARMLPIIRQLAEAGRAICLVEHNLEVIRSLCDTAVYLDEGRVVAVGAPETLMADPVLAARYFQ